MLQLPVHKDDDMISPPEPGFSGLINRSGSQFHPLTTGLDGKIQLTGMFRHCTGFFWRPGSGGLINRSVSHHPFRGWTAGETTADGMMLSGRLSEGLPGSPKQTCGYGFCFQDSAGSRRRIHGHATAFALIRERAIGPFGESCSLYNTPCWERDMSHFPKIWMPRPRNGRLDDTAP